VRAYGEMREEGGKKRRGLYCRVHQSIEIVATGRSPIASLQAQSRCAAWQGLNDISSGGLGFSPEGLASCRQTWLVRQQTSRIPAGLGQGTRPTTPLTPFSLPISIVGIDLAAKAEDSNETEEEMSGRWL